MYRASCPFYVSQTDAAHLFFINCNNNGKYADCVQTQFKTKTDRRTKLVLHCNSKKEYCEVFKHFREVIK